MATPIAFSKSLPLAAIHGSRKRLCSSLRQELASVLERKSSNSKRSDSQDFILKLLFVQAYRCTAKDAKACKQFDALVVLETCLCIAPGRFKFIPFRLEGLLLNVLIQYFLASCWHYGTWSKISLALVYD